MSMRQLSSEISVFEIADGMKHAHQTPPRRPVAPRQKRQALNQQKKWEVTTTLIGASRDIAAPLVYVPLICIDGKPEKVRFADYGATKLTRRELITRLLSDALKSATEPSKIQIQSNNVSINLKRQQKQAHAAGHDLRIAFRYGTVPMPYRYRSKGAADGCYRARLNRRGGVYERIRAEHPLLSRCETRQHPHREHTP